MYCSVCNLAVAQGDREARKINNTVMHGNCLRNLTSNTNPRQPYNLLKQINTAVNSVNPNNAPVRFAC